MDGKCEALVRLLADNDPATVKLVKDQLAEEEMLPLLHELAECDNEVVSGHAREVLAQVESGGAWHEFELQCVFFPRDGDLENVVWRLASLMRPNVKVAGARRKMSAWGRELRLHLQSAVSAYERALVLGAYMAGNLKFRGNSENYYAVENSLLPCVVEARRGIPLSLSLIYLFTARRAGMDVEGVNLPGHFIIRHEQIFIDPFHGGKILSEQDCLEIMARQNLPRDPSCLRPAESREILRRVAPI